MSVGVPEQEQKRREIALKHAINSAEYKASDEAILIIAEKFRKFLAGEEINEAK